MPTLKEYSATINNIAATKELLDLTKLSEDFNKARDATLPPKKRINILIATILKATSYEERLTEVKIRLQRIETSILRDKISYRNSVMSTNKRFFTMSKKDQDFLFEKESKDIVIATKLVEQKLAIVATSLEYVRSANFNMKAILSTLKEHLNVIADR